VLCVFVVSECVCKRASIAISGQSVSLLLSCINGDLVLTREAAHPAITLMDTWQNWENKCQTAVHILLMDGTSVTYIIILGGGTAPHAG